MPRLLTLGAIRSAAWLNLVSVGLVNLSAAGLVISLVLSLMATVHEKPPAVCAGRDTSLASNQLELCAAPAEERRWELAIGTTIRSKKGYDNWSSPGDVTCRMAGPGGTPELVSGVRPLEYGNTYSGTISITGDVSALEIGAAFRVPALPAGGSAEVTLQGRCTGTVYHPEPKDRGFLVRKVDLNVPVQLHIAEKYRYQAPPHPFLKAALISFLLLLASGIAWVWSWSWMDKSIQALNDEATLRGIAGLRFEMPSEMAKDRLKAVRAKSPR